MIKEIKLPDLNGGLNTRDPETGINDNQSPDMLNLWYKDKALTKRDGQQLVTTLTGVYRVSPTYNNYRAVHAGSKLYKWDGTTATEIKTGVQDQSGVFVEFGDDLFYIDGSEIWSIDSSYTVTAVTPYKPFVLITTAPGGAGTTYEAYNMIGRGFRVKFSSDGTSTTYTLPNTDLDSDTVEISVNTVDLTEGTHFTVNRTAGTIDFSGGTTPHGAPAAGTDNVWVTAYRKTSAISTSKAKITGCTIGLPFGGESSSVDGGSRVFLMGNATYPLHYWRSDLGLSQRYGMTYFPDTSEELLDMNSDKITTAAKMQGELIIFKEHSIFAVGYAFDGENVYYPVRECHSSIGCDIPRSVQLIDNNLVFANTTDGVMMLINKSNKLENIVKPLSANINSLLLKESNLADAVSTDYERYYWLAVNGNVYLWDYEQTPYKNYRDYEKAQRELAWYKFDNISPTEFFFDSDLYYGSEDGIVKFIEYKNDFGNAIASYMYTKAINIGDPHVIKTFRKLYAELNTDNNVNVTITVGSDKNDARKSKTFSIPSFSWSGFSWDEFTWKVVRFSKTVVMKLNIKKTRHIQVKIESNELNKGVGLLSLIILYYNNRNVKR